MANLFLVEDHDIMRRTLATLLNREEDFIVCGEAASGAEALTLLEEISPDLLLVDISMPGMDGIELLHRVRDQWPHLPCLILSGHDASVYRDQARAAGALAYIDKRNVHEIVPTIRRALDDGRTKGAN